MLPSESAQALLDALSLEIISDKVPDNFYSVEEVAEMCGQSHTTIRRKLREQIKSGEVVMRKFKIAGCREPVPHYGKA